MAWHGAQASQPETWCAWVSVRSHPPPSWCWLSLCYIVFSLRRSSHGWHKLACSAAVEAAIADGKQQAGKQQNHHVDKVNSPVQVSKFYVINGGQNAQCMATLRWCVMPCRPDRGTITSMSALCGAHRCYNYARLRSQCWRLPLCILAGGFQR
jgi:hypothetical protein